MIDLDYEAYKSQTPTARIKVLGVGGAGCNTLGSFLQNDEAIECIAANTDAQSLDSVATEQKIKLGYKITKGLGSGSDPEIGAKAAEEDIEHILQSVQDADIVFLTSGLGGGTGSGALPVIARHLAERNILCVAVVTKPFDFEGKRRKNVAEEALQKLRDNVDTLIVLPNQKLLSVAESNVSLIDAFDIVNGVVRQFVTSISHIVTKPGHINVDFADIRAIMKDMGAAIMGTGRASGQNRAEEAIQQAISSPLLEEHAITGARGILLNITGSHNLGLHEVSKAASLLYEQADEEASIVLGSVIDERMEDEIAITIIATGFEENRPQKAPETATTSEKQHSQPSQQAPQPHHITPAASDQETPDNATDRHDPSDLETPAILRNGGNTQHGQPNQS